MFICSNLEIAEPWSKTTGLVESLNFAESLFTGFEVITRDPFLSPLIFLTHIFSASFILLLLPFFLHYHVMDFPNYLQIKRGEIFFWLSSYFFSTFCRIVIQHFLLWFFSIFMFKLIYCDKYIHLSILWYPLCIIWKADQTYNKNQPD